MSLHGFRPRMFPTTVSHATRALLDGLCHGPALLFLAEHRYPLTPSAQFQLTQARRRFCTFHGLLRWASKFLSGVVKADTIKFQVLQPASSRAGPEQEQEAQGWQLLCHVAALPAELVRMIAVAADLQHDLNVLPTLFEDLTI